MRGVIQKVIKPEFSLSVSCQKTKKPNFSLDFT